MFERYTEKARRSIFFARYEASQCGSPRIETEHLLLGILREDKRVTSVLCQEIDACEAIRKAVEAQTKRGERIPTAVDVPLSPESKQILNLAAESADRLGHRHVECIHLILGMLRVEKCTAARLLGAHSVDERKVEATISERADPAAIDLRVTHGETPRAAAGREELHKTAAKVVDPWATCDAAGLARCFAANGQFGDSRGTQWSGAELEKGIKAQFGSHKIEVQPVAPESIQSLSPVSAVVTLTARASASQRLVLVLRDIQMQWQVVSAHISVLETS